MTIEQNEIIDNFTRHIQVMHGLAPSSVKAYRHNVKAFEAWRAGQNAIDGPVTRQDIEGYLEKLFYAGNSNSTRITKSTAIKKYCRYLRYAGIQADDPTVDLPQPRATRLFMQTFTHDEIIKMFATIDISREKGLRDAVFLIMGAFCGFRVSEITSCNIENIDDDGKHLDLVIPRTKRDSGRVVYVWKIPAAFIRQLLNARISAGARTGDPLLVSYHKSGRPRGNLRLNTKSLDNLIKTLGKRAGLRKPTIRCHMLRGSHACDLQRINGYVTQSIQERLGIRNLATLEHYLVRRERLHKMYPSLHAYWINFGSIWTKGGSNSEGNNSAE